MLMRRRDQDKIHLLAASRTTVLAWVMLAVFGASASHAVAQAVAEPASAPLAVASAKASAVTSPAKTKTVSKISFKPDWQDLTPLQQTSLKPLAEKWSTLGETQKRKWIAIAANYPKLAAPEQAKLHSRMTEWVSLSQQQRAQARLNFAESKKLTPTQKTATWTAYQALSPEEKQKLAHAATAKPSGAAAAVKPVSPQKITAVPVSRQTTKATPKMAAASQSLDRNTLLPRSKAASDPSPAPQN
jgi:hypothetical protein